MKSNNLFVRAVVGLTLLIIAGFVIPGNSQSLSIVVQPQSQTNSYGSDVVFAVDVAGEEPLTYQWQKNGVNLADYENISGSQSPSLEVVGISGSDVAGYTVIISNASTSITSVVATLSLQPVLEFEENFESGLTNWHQLTGDTALILDNTRNHTPGGISSALLTNANQRIFHNLATKMPGRARLNFWMYDAGQAVSVGELRGYTGPGYGNYSNPGGLKQELAIGEYSLPFPTNGTGSLAQELVDTTVYQARVWRGSNSGWLNLNASGSPKRSIGWHKFGVDRSADGTSVNFYVDDVLSREVSGATFVPLNCVVLGADGKPASEARSGSAWFDDVRVESFPETFEWQSLATLPPLFDWMKLRETGTNARAANGLRITTMSSIDAKNTNGGFGDWDIERSGITATGLRGYLDYVISVPSADSYRLEIEGCEKSFQIPAVELPLDISLDGEFLGRFNLPYGGTTNGMVHCFTPFIQTGSHTVRIFWDNANGYRKLHLRALRVQSVGNSEFVDNGVKLWVANRLRAQSGFDTVPINSLISPACVEGKGQFLSMMSLMAGTAAPLSPVNISHGPGNRWYANVPLAPEKPAMVVASFQNGGYSETNEITWQPANLLGSNSITIRAGDSLLFTALPEGETNGTVNVSIGTNETFTTDGHTPVPHRFSLPGTYVVYGGFDGKVTGSYTVTVVAASFGGPAPARLNRGRFWDCTNLPPGVVIDADPRLRIVPISNEERSRETPTPAPFGPNGRQFRVWTHSTEPRYIAARLYPGGPILDSTSINGFRWFTAPDSYLRRTQTKDDGSDLVESTFIMSPLYPAVSAALEIIASGVTFDDGTITRTLTATNFDQMGQTKINFIRAAGVKTSVCHVTKLYDNDYLIGWK